MFLYTGFDGHEMHFNIIAIFDHTGNDSKLG
jgi:hypothetical protein